MRLWPRDGARGVALFFGLFSLLNLIGELRTPGFDANVWWLDLRPLPASATVVILAAAGVLLMWWGLRPAAAAWRRVATPVTAAGLSLVALHNGVTFYRVWEAGRIEPWVPLPLSFVLAAALLCIAWTAARPVPERPDPAVPSQARLPTARSYREGFVQVRIAPPLRRWWSPLLVLTTVVACGILFPLGQQAFFGKTTYVRSTQVAVVFGAQVHRDGRPTLTLAGRVRTAAELYRAGSTQRLLVSGARGVGEPVNEATAMRTAAMQYGVPASAIEVDPGGANTDATVRNTVASLRAAGLSRVAVVSDFFHLPRIKLAYQRAGLDVTTVPSHTRYIPQTPRLVAREILAFWVYYVRAVAR